ncbi:TruD domain-containing protein/HEAT domain-containing protein [Cephalotus follicularis]|uniref:TruD domain-containing protein/HEAT domain-containing protein n=1 Tax=Cephalotus follicularis TaxID=3775 RepID=A0A1Q3CMV0_CEPFO|nr:TruD domain-containing protein/HEAT domain-containing protein [Cephalotus follicularis]
MILEKVQKRMRFHLYKENKDTQEALGLIGKMLGIQSRSFGFAGTMDKHSVRNSLFVATELPLQRAILPPILQMLSDSNLAVREAAILCIEEMYRQAGSQFRDDFNDIISLHIW